MGKICDPPPFRGGQCVGKVYAIEYKITFENGQVRYHNDESPSLVSLPSNCASYTNRVGPITGNISVIWNPSGFGGFNQGKIYLDGVYSTYFFPLDGKNTASVVLNKVTPCSGVDNCGDLPSTNCRCSDDSCRVDCASAPDGFCCIDNSLTDRLLQLIKN